MPKWQRPWKSIPMLEWSGSARLRAEWWMFCSSESRRAQRKQELNVALTCPRCVQKVRVELRKCLGENGRHVGTRTPDLYRVNAPTTSNRLTFQAPVATRSA